MQLETLFKFWPVGQGGFYSGSFKLETNDEFNIVFDCGSISSKRALNESITAYNYFNERDVDILFLSHLDQDHVNGLSQLLKNRNCKYVVMPYYTLIERFYLGLYYLIDTDDDESEDKDWDTDYIDFIENPVDFIVKNCPNVENIIFIKGNEDKKLSEPTDDKVLIEEFNLDVNLETAVIEENLESFEEQNQVKVLFKKGGGSLILQRLWEFRVLHAEYDCNLFKLFKDKVNEFDGFNECDFSFLREIKKLKNLRSFLLTESKTKININNTGIAVLHFPLFQKVGVRSSNRNFTNNRKWRLPWSFGYCQSRHQPYNRAFTLLTGDIGFSIIASFPDVKYNLGRISFFQIPHHGSRTGWDYEFFGNEHLSTCLQTVIQHGFKRSAHPNNMVLQNLINHKIQFWLVNEYQSFSYLIEIHRQL